MSAKENRVARDSFNHREYNLNEIFEKLTQYVKEIRYGSVLMIQDGKIVQIEKNEKERFV